jgi:hypothetical protein
MLVMPQVDGVLAMLAVAFLNTNEEGPSFALEKGTTQDPCLRGVAVESWGAP